MGVNWCYGTMIGDDSPSIVFFCRFTFSKWFGKPLVSRIIIHDMHIYSPLHTKDSCQITAELSCTTIMVANSNCIPKQASSGDDCDFYH